MKVVIAPDSFKESLPAGQVAEAVARGVLAVAPDAVIDLVPMADGGEGTVEAMVRACGGRYEYADVFGPLGQPVRARYARLGRRSRQATALLPGELGLSAVAGQDDAELSEIAVIEMAAASGLQLVGPESRDPLRTTTFGTGQLILAALEAGARQVILGIGGSATCDLGAGAAQALGVTFLDAEGQSSVCGLAGGGLADIARIDMSDRDERLEQVRIRIACDVTNPLLGASGAAAVYAPQKGATPEQAQRLEANLSHLAGLIHQQLGLDVTSLSGGGAAGGLGAGLVAFTGATLEGGLELVAEAVGLRRRLAGADLCITGEGRLDASSAHGKTAVAIAKIAAELDVPTLCIPGTVTRDAPSEVFAGVNPLVNPQTLPEESLARTADLLGERTAELLGHILRKGS
ncbi:MAG: glycerate kinase [Planctomycetota bacterium]